VQAVYDRIFAPDRDPVADPGTSTGSPGDFWTVLANVPGVITHIMGYTQVFADDSPLGRQLREVVICRTAFNIGSKFEFSQHRKFLRDTGYSEPKAADITAWASSDLFSVEERALLAYVDELTLCAGRTQDETFRRLQSHFSDVQIIEIAYVAAQYVAYGLLIKSLRLEYDDIPERVEEVPAL
ncbi:MAG: carboxymuconolactone decarboxylase family protein, partial [Acidimicrobiales bacterium]